MIKITKLKSDILNIAHVLIFKISELVPMAIIAKFRKTDRHPIEQKTHTLKIHPDR